MTNYTISFTVEGQNLDPILSTIVDRINDLSIGVVTAGTELSTNRTRWLGNKLINSSNGRANGKNYKRTRSGPLTTRDKLWQTIANKSTFTRNELLAEAKKHKTNAGSISSALGDWKRRGLIESTGFGTYQRMS